MLLAAFAVFFSVRLWQRCVNDFAWDYAINWIAAQGMKSGLSLYNESGLRQLGLTLIGPQASALFTGPFGSYIGLPSTAFLLLPFTFGSFSASLLAYRVLSLAAFVASVFVAGHALPAADRRTGWLWGGLALLTIDPVVTALQLGQLDGWIALALAVALWAARRDRWYLVGIAAGLAALLKISPGILIVYCVMRRKWKAAVAAAGFAVLILGLATTVGLSSDLWVFSRKILPSLAIGTLHMQNQSLTAWLARIFLPDTDLLNYSTGLGVFRFVGAALIIILVVATWSVSRRQAMVSLELGTLTLAAMLIGPLTWDHYFAWAVVPLTQLADSRLWSQQSSRQRSEILALLIMGGVLLALPMIYFPSTAIATHWALRFATGIKTLGALIWFGVSLGLLGKINSLDNRLPSDYHPPHAPHR